MIIPHYFNDYVKFENHSKKGKKGNQKLMNDF